MNMYSNLIKIMQYRTNDILEAQENLIERQYKVLETIKLINADLKRISEDIEADRKAEDDYIPKREVEMTIHSNLLNAHGINSAYEQSQNDRDTETIADDILKAAGWSKEDLNINRGGVK